MGAHGFQLCWASHVLIFWSRKLWGNLGRTLSWEIEAQALFLQVSVTSLIYKVTGKSCRAGTSSSECRLLSPVLSPCHFWLIALHHSSKDQSHPMWPRSRCLLGLQWCPLFVDLGSQAFLGFASKKKNKKIYSWRWYMYCDGRVETGESYIKINIWEKAGWQREAGNHSPPGLHTRNKQSMLKKNLW